MAVDSGASANIVDEERFRKIQEISEKKLILKKFNVRLYGCGSQVPIPVAGKFEAVVETKDKAISAVFIVAKGKKDGEMLLGCDTAIELGVLKIVKSIEKEETMPRPAVADIISEYDGLFHGIDKHKHAKVKIHVEETVQPVAQANRKIPYHYHDKVKEQLQKPDSKPTMWISLSCMSHFVCVCHEVGRGQQEKKN